MQTHLVEGGWLERGHGIVGLVVFPCSPGEDILFDQLAVDTEPAGCSRQCVLRRGNLPTGSLGSKCCAIIESIG